jgi:hypothetical protein
MFLALAVGTGSLQLAFSNREYQVTNPSSWSISDGVTPTGVLGSFSPPFRDLRRRAFGTYQMRTRDAERESQGNKALVATCIACQKTLSTEVMVSLTGCEDGRPKQFTVCVPCANAGWRPPASAASIHFASNTGRRRAPCGTPARERATEILSESLVEERKSQFQLGRFP